MIDDENGLPLLTNTVSCLAPFQYHREWGTEFNPILLQPGDYLIEARKGSDIAEALLPRGGVRLPARPRARLPVR